MAPDTRQALRGIREQLGDDAVILSSKRTPEGVEVTAAVDFDATRLESESTVLAPQPRPQPKPAPARKSEWSGHVTAPAAPARAAAAPAVAPALAPAPAAPQIDPAIAAVAAKLRAAAATPTPAAPRAPLRAPAAARIPERAAPASTPAAPPRTGAVAARPIAQPPAAPAPLAQTPSAPPAPGAPPAPAPAATTAAMDHMNHELKIMRRMLETQLEQLAWNERTRRTPVIAEMLRELTEMGIAQDLAERIGEQLPTDVDLASARRFAIAGLSQYLRTAGPRWQDDGGRVALVGATGAGKSTTLAKLAVRWVLRHGARDLALVAADTVRIGAQDQLQALGQLLGAPVYAPDGFAGLPVLLAQLSRFRMVLIDTPGTSVRDPQLAARLTVLANSASQLESALVLPANMQAGAMDEAVKRFAPANPSCCLITKMDEAASLGGVLSVLIRTRLPVAYVSGGQRVPEDLAPARALDLVSQAVQLARTNQASVDEDLLRRRFGRKSHGST
jgi:flagellar biosynthesis protein FlhF